MTDQHTLRAILVNETPNAILVKKAVLDEPVWIPRSQIGYMKKTPENAGTTVEFTVPEWLVEKKDLWSMVP